MTVERFDRRKIELYPWVMVSFHLRAEGKIDLKTHNEFKSWKYQCILRTVLNDVIRPEVPLRAADIFFGPNTDTYLCTRIRVFEEKDCRKIQRNLQNGNEQEKVNKAINAAIESTIEVKEITCEVVDSRNSKKDTVLSVSFTSDFDVKLLNDRENDAQDHVLDCLKRAVIDCYELKLSSSRILITSTME
eukprot:UN29969